jgi:hypothetical protein
MGDPDLRSDESVILRTQGIFVKSIPFEGILTNKRIILLDKAKNLLPQKEIPLVTIKDLEVGENAIRDQIITLSVVAKSGEVRQMILTFSRQTGGNRIRERDAWAKALKENISSSFEQVVRKVIPGRGPAPKKPERTIPPRIEVISSESPNLPPVMKTSSKKETKVRPPVKISENTKTPPRSSALGKESGLSGFGTYCSRCGNRVPEGSGFCNRCGSPIVLPVTPAAPSGKVPQPSKPETVERTIPPTGPVENPADLTVDRSAAGTKVVPLPDVPQQPETSQVSDTFVLPQEIADVFSSDMTDIVDEKPGPETPVPVTRDPKSSPAAGEPPAPRKPRNFGIKPGRNTVYGIVIVFLIIAVIVGGFFMYPQIAKSRSAAPDTSVSPTPVTTTLSPSDITIRPTPVVTVPPEGVYVHIKYIGGWKGSYGIPSDLKTVTNSGDRYYPVENATGTVEASFEKLDSSGKQTLIVEILKNGKTLTSGNTTADSEYVTFLWILERYSKPLLDQSGATTAASAKNS